MKILDRYLLFKFLKAFVFSMFIINLIILVIDYTEKNQKFNRAGLSWAEIAGYYIDYMPWVSNLAVPLITFIACVFITSRLATHTEIVAMLSSGISFRRLLVPYVVGALAIGGFNFWLNGWVIPNSNKDRVAFEVKYLEKPYNFNERNYHLRLSPNSYFYLENYTIRSQIGYKVSLETIEDHELKSKLTGARIEWNPEKELWTLKNWQQRTFLPNGEEKFTAGLELDTLLSITPKDFENDYRRFETLTINQLIDYMGMLRERGSEGIEDYQVELHIRFAAPFAILILTIIGVLVSARKARGGTGAMIAVGFGLAFVFTLFFILTRSLATSGDLPIMLAAWLPNLTFGVLAFFMYRKLPR